MALESAFETIAPAPTLSGVVIGIGSYDPNKLETQRSIEPHPIRFIRHPAIEISIIVYCLRLKSTPELLRNRPRDRGGELWQFLPESKSVILEFTKSEAAKCLILRLSGDSAQSGSGISSNWPGGSDGRPFTAG
jgi:hypothetical protein